MLPRPGAAAAAPLTAGGVRGAAPGSGPGMTQTFVDSLGVHGTTAEDGTARLQLDATETHLNAAGTL